MPACWWRQLTKLEKLPAHLREISFVFPGPHLDELAELAAVRAGVEREPFHGLKAIMLIR